jgi:hypothetical protein
MVSVVRVGLEYYKNDPFSATVYIVETQSEQKASDAYVAIKEGYHFSWTDENLSLGGGESAVRIGDYNTYWLLNAHKKKYFVEVIVRPLAATNSEQTAKDFTAAVLNKITL